MCFSDMGICDELAKIAKRIHGLDVDPLTDIVICCGQTEAFAAAVFSVINPGDEVVIFNPSFDTYGNVVSIAGGVPVYVTLDPPNWNLDPNKLLKSFTSRTKAIVLNSPHNPTGKVFSKDELDAIAGACCTNDCLVITDEVYEYITFGDAKHISLASLPGMQGRTIITSSLSKTFSVTGWRIGWAIAPAFIASAMRNIHVRVTDSAPAPFQEAALIALQSPPEFFESLRRDYESKRDYVAKLLMNLGFRIPYEPQGSLFLFAELPKSCTLTDVECVEELVRRAGVVAVPGCGFFHTDSSKEKHDEEACRFQKRYIRFAFCKSNETLSAAAQKLKETDFEFLKHL
ncbi:kynurenine--oxoglutarate transaminase 1-like isoform X2 [Momordica charantia]|uniref:Kynurenine--oxoglutarate transaminase 1-like isoform X2 n=1 Tax=Momordica charantia TaxID=3673 RepID=A0A6J1DJ02_MOMCH|nr:kynurenine--oxoglutarate transaminase 1-like isoform X2 [Momordica charantia]